MREFGSEHPSITLPDGYFKTFGNYGYRVDYLRSGRESLLCVALDLGAKLCSDSLTVLLPAYSCWSMVVPFEKAGWKVVFYRLNEDLTVDLGYLKDLISRTAPQAVLTMNFFGSANTGKAIELIKKCNKDIKIIEDFSHLTFCFKLIFNPDVDYYISSIRKSIGIPDGAIVLSKDCLAIEDVKDSEMAFVNERRNAQNLKFEYNYSKSAHDKSKFRTSLVGCEKKLDDFDSVHSISDISIKMLMHVNGKMISFARRENMFHLWNLLEHDVEMVPEITESFSGAPFSLPILVKDRDNVQRRLAEKGLYTQVLWPVRKEAQLICPVSKRMSEEMLSVPIDQRYGWDDIEDIARILLSVI